MRAERRHLAGRAEANGGVSFRVVHDSTKSHVVRDRSALPADLVMAPIPERSGVLGREFRDECEKVRCGCRRGQNLTSPRLPALGGCRFRNKRLRQSGVYGAWVIGCQTGIGKGALPFNGEGSDQHIESRLGGAITEPAA